MLFACSPKGSTGKKLGRGFYERDGITVARELIGKVLVHETKDGIIKGRIVESEAYMGEKDAAAHSYKKRSPNGRTNIQYGEGGHAYVYLIYGMYCCFNVVANGKDIPECVLIRALEPVDGIETMKKNRKTDKEKNLCSGPGKLCQAMEIDRECYGMDLCGEVLYIEDWGEDCPEDMIEQSPRINIDYAGEAAEYPWRFTKKDSPYLSVKKKKR